MLSILVIISALLIIQRTGALQLQEPPDLIMAPPPPDLTNYVEKELPNPPTREITRVIDLAQDLSNEEKFAYIVVQSDGSYEKILLPYDFSGDPGELIGLNIDEKIVNSYFCGEGPAVYIANTPPETPVITPTPIPPTAVENPCLIRQLYRPIRFPQADRINTVKRSCAMPPALLGSRTFLRPL